MINGLNSIDNAILSSGSGGGLLSGLDGSPSFDSIFSQAMSQAQTPAQKAQVALQEVQYDNLNTLYDAVSGNSSDSLFGSSLGMLATDLGSVSSQLSQLEQWLGIGSGSTASSAPPALDMNTALSLEAQQLINNDIASFGTDGSSGINSLV
jgi:hypothetical protein